MLQFDWMETFELDVPEIDGDHKAMLDLMKEVRATAKSGDRARCQAYVQRLLTFAGWHFHREEAFLKRHDYPQLTKHAGYHRSLLHRADSVALACASLDTQDEYQECCDELMSFQIDDVVRGDLMLKSFLQDAGLTRTQQNNRTQPQSAQL